MFTTILGAMSIGAGIGGAIATIAGASVELGAAVGTCAGAGVGAAVAAAEAEEYAY